MRKSASFIVLLCSVIVISRSYAIDGAWRLTDIQDTHLSSNVSVGITIKDFVFRNQTVRWSLSAMGCQNLKIMMDIQGKNIFMDTNTLYVDSSNVKNCAPENIVADKRFQALLKKVFTFQMITNFMMFSDPDGSVLFKFQRTGNSSNLLNLTGAWMITTLNSKPTSHLVEISNNNIVFCQRFALVNYTSIAGTNRL